MNQTPQEIIKTVEQLLGNDEQEKAISQLTTAVEALPLNLELRYMLAKLLAKSSHLEAALVQFNVLIEQSPKNPLYYSDRGVAHHLSGNNELALSDLNKAAELEPAKPFRYSSRAFIKERMGDLKGALEDYERTIQLDPEDAIAHNNKGLIEEKMGYAAQSQDSFKRADSLDPNYKGTQADQPVTTPPKTTPSTPEPVQEDSQQLGWSDYMSQMKKLVKSPEERKEFVSFIKSKIKGEA